MKISDPVAPDLVCPICGNEDLSFDTAFNRWYCNHTSCGLRSKSLMNPCPVCHAETYCVKGHSFCLNPKCMKHISTDETVLVNKPRIIIEIRDGALTTAYADADVELILVDFDELDSGASAVIIPDTMCCVPEKIKRLVNDAVERH